MVKIFVGNINDPQSDMEAQLRSSFAAFGLVTECSLMRDYAFVHMDSEMAAREAVRCLHGALIGNCRVNVEFSRSSGDRRYAGGGSGGNRANSGRGGGGGGVSSYGIPVRLSDRRHHPDTTVSVAASVPPQPLPPAPPPSQSRFGSGQEGYFIGNGLGPITHQQMHQQYQVHGGQQEQQQQLGLDLPGQFAGNHRANLGNGSQQQPAAAHGFNFGSTFPAGLGAIGGGGDLPPFGGGGGGGGGGIYGAPPGGQPAPEVHDASSGGASFTRFGHELSAQSKFGANTGGPPGRRTVGQSQGGGAGGGGPIADAAVAAAVAAIANSRHGDRDVRRYHPYGVDGQR